MKGSAGRLFGCNQLKDIVLLLKIVKMTFEQRKYRLIQEIILANQAELIDAIDDTIKNFTKKEEEINLANHKNIEKTVDLSKIKKERPLVDLDMEQFATEANDLEWDKSVVELLTELD